MYKMYSTISLGLASCPFYEGYPLFGGSIIAGSTVVSFIISVVIMYLQYNFLHIVTPSCT